MTGQTSELLGKLRGLLVDLHKTLLDRERLEYEKVHGPIDGPMPFFALVLGDPHFAWLKEISTLIVEIDGALSRRSPASQPVAEALIQQIGEMLTLNEHGTTFQARYYASVQESPDVIILQCKIEQLLGK